MRDDIPARMRHLERDARGYPLFAMIYRDEDGRGHFTVNDHQKRHKLLMADRCSICGTKLFRGRWFVGGPGSAFHPRGAYVDPPMHDECAHYALRVCPYLATPNYGKAIAARTVAKDEPVALAEITNVGAFQPDVFVAVMARGQKITSSNAFVDYIRPQRPFIRVEFWRHGRMLDQIEGGRFANAIMSELMRDNP